MLELDELNFEKHVNVSGIVIVDCYTPWCSPCKVLSKRLEEITDLKIYKLNVEESPNLATVYSVTSVPKLLYFLDGKLVHSSVGLVTVGQIRGMVSTLYK